MISTSLYNDLRPHLVEAKEVWIAVALMTEAAFNKIQQTIPPTAHQHYLVGIDLPTSPAVFNQFKKLQGEKFEAVVLKLANTFHPKVYIIRKESKLVAFIGSANATNGGFFNNYEICFRIEAEDQCEKLLSWFNELYQMGKEITDKFIEEYAAVYNKNRIWSSTQQSNISSLFSSINAMNINAPVVNGQFFRQSDYLAFASRFHTDKSVSAKTERKKVRLRLLELHDLIYPKFKSYGMNDLHTPSSRRNYTSQYFHTPRSSEVKDAIWLNYGKSITQLSESDDNNFTNNVRIQVILRNGEKERYFGIWLFVGKPFKSVEDRIYLKEQLENNDFLNLVKNFLVQLGDSYWINIGEKELEIADIYENNDLRDFLFKDDFSEYYIIGRNYDANSEEINEANIAETVLIEFSKLYKLYELIKAR